MAFGIGIEIIIIFLAALISTHFVLPFFIQRMHARKIVGKDMNKPSHPEVAEMGGTIVLLGFVFAVMIALFGHTHLGFFQGVELLPLLAAMLTIVLVGILGIIDDLIGWKKGLRQYQHALIPIFAALPLMVLPSTIGNTGIAVPFFGFVNFGILYSLVLVPLAVTGASNASNMLAGLNGLEAGIGLINALALLAVAVVLGRTEVIILMACLSGALLAFLRFNWFPAKIFPGDSLTLMMGAGIAAGVIIGNMEKIGLMLFALYFIELILKASTRFQGESFGQVQPDGTLHAPSKLASLTHVMMLLGKNKWDEKKVVLSLLVLQLGVALFTLLIFWINYSYFPGNV